MKKNIFFKKWITHVRVGPVECYYEGIAAVVGTEYNG